MYVKKIRSFIVLATSDSFRDAAEKLNITQPTLTKQIQILEEIFGFKLFLRDNQGCYLTEEGKIIYKYAVNLANELDRLFCVVKKIKNGTTGVLNIGYTFSCINRLPEIINNYTEHHPMIKIQLHELSSAEQEKKLLSGELDIAFMEKPTNKQIKYTEIGSDHLVFIFNQKENFKINDFNDVNQILDKNTLCLPDYDSHFDLSQKIAKYLSSNALNYPNVYYTNNVYNIISMANLHSNVTILPNSLVDNLKSTIKYKKLMGKGSKWKIGVSWNEEKAGKDVLTFINEIRDK